MPYADITQLMSVARTRIPGVLDGALQLELYEVTKEFLATSNVWQEDIDFTTIANTTSYVVVPTDGTIERLFWVLDENDIPVAATMQVPGEVVLDNEPTGGDDLTATVVLKPSDLDGDGYPVFPEWIYTKYGGVFLDGLLGRMMSQVAKPYSNERLSVYHMRRFRDGMAIAKSESQRKNTPRQAWRFPRFGR